MKTSNTELCVFSTIFMFILGGVNSTLESDKITRLPDQPKVDFQQFSGHITIDETHQRALFYYFVEAEVDPASKPVVLWLNGGPGCSSVGQGSFSEHGPFKPTRKGLVKNSFSWNKANMIYLDSPIGVGFSYSANKSDYFLVNDQITARDNLLFLQGWFSRFPMHRSSDFFITGESYAGHFAPQLAELIIQTNANIRLKGIAIGNPLLEFNTDFSSGAEFLWSHGQIQDSTYQMLKTVCSVAEIRRQSRTGKLSNACDKVNRLLSMETYF
ncbi:putative carboxypeptidase D [Medicago truncatula]|uniref:Carboxypeptidase n=1 Tax=Medicago truncatula TaxID=3880 RepID=A0A396JQD7_MEDTR|nr:putative carboxypeptidase D [Medicago truncatula]